MHCLLIIKYLFLSSYCCVCLLWWCQSDNLIPRNWNLQFVGFTKPLTFSLIIVFLIIRSLFLIISHSLPFLTHLIHSQWLFNEQYFPHLKHYQWHSPTQPQTFIVIHSHHRFYRPWDCDNSVCIVVVVVTLNGMLLQHIQGKKLLLLLITTFSLRNIEIFIQWELPIIILLKNILHTQQQPV